MPFVTGRLAYHSSPFRYKYPIHRFKFHHQCPIIMPKHRFELSRPFRTTAVALGEDDTYISRHGHDDIDSKDHDEDTASRGIFAAKFHALDKGMAIMSTKIDRIQHDVRDLSCKADTVLFIILGAVILKGGFDLFRDERNYAREHH
ncbi:hypothetical protein B9Z19DRAFT_1068883 [Tuber borchii]|uniref:Uncharacterized protein n=1 Tax=Tuber borchii TaxID=42251 RepID=A0A2T6ZDJ5_TUBBO|nr:hypothetical protein B9Z19DRAFT_1068883 [Tuber borchii]